MCLCWCAPACMCVTICITLYQCHSMCKIESFSTSLRYCLCYPCYLAVYIYLYVSVFLCVSHSVSVTVCLCQYICVCLTVSAHIWVRVSPCSMGCESSSAPLCSSALAPMKTSDPSSAPPKIGWEGSKEEEEGEEEEWRRKEDGCVLRGGYGIKC
jgi:hypothetical protein